MAGGPPPLCPLGALLSFGVTKRTKANGEREKERVLLVDAANERVLKLDGPRVARTIKLEEVLSVDVEDERDVTIAFADARQGHGTNTFGCQSPEDALALVWVLRACMRAVAEGLRVSESLEALLSPGAAPPAVGLDRSILYHGPLSLRAANGTWTPVLATAVPGKLVVHKDHPLLALSLAHARLEADPAQHTTLDVVLRDRRAFLAVPPEGGRAARNVVLEALSAAVLLVDPETGAYESLQVRLAAHASKTRRRSSITEEDSPTQAQPGAMEAEGNAANRSVCLTTHYYFHFAALKNAKDPAEPARRVLLQLDGSRKALGLGAYGTIEKRILSTSLSPAEALGATGAKVVAQRGAEKDPREYTFDFQSRIDRDAFLSAYCRVVGCEQPIPLPSTSAFSRVVLKSGFLELRPAIGDGAVGPIFVRRFCVLVPHRMFVFLNANATHPTDVYAVMPECRVAHGVNGSRSQFSLPLALGTSELVCVSDFNAVHFNAPSTMEAEDWVRCLGAAASHPLPAVKEAPAAPPPAPAPEAAPAPSSDSAGSARAAPASKPSPAPERKSIFGSVVRDRGFDEVMTKEGVFGFWGLKK